jgi:hypothetical protein
MRPADHKPMSLQRFRTEFVDEIGHRNKDVSDIDRLSDDVSIVEKAYDDMDQFDNKVESLKNAQEIRFSRPKPQPRKVGHRHIQQKKGNIGIVNPQPKNAIHPQKSLIRY